ncbi:MAG: tRNA uridine-5-carboxymethylaminomethyl(34) synthesis GTPase MnmE [Clostridia bacterium]|nr:tRNA uridine-5-carboxymethylaminomethyl(34) synthesis GTPase MnmE [Clostridia bacterium]MBR7092172.1 tRNA uridine-5-carboxymethylaminomethyl(34) synthesis GTPase MnmE [Clostridia bacterium]
MESTVAAIATPLASSGIGVVRISGPQALDVAAAVFRPARQGRSVLRMAGYTAAFGRVADADGAFDECVLTVFRAPHSYTGEDVAELSCHGGPYLLRRALQAAYAAGAVPAGPGEFTKRAFLNGKTDLTGAEAVMSIIGAQGKLAARTALAAREGAVFQVLAQVRGALLGVQAQFSAFVDYPDEEIPDLSPQALRQTLAQAQDVLRRLIGSFEAGRVLREGIDTVIVGAPNVGKSTLMNLLAHSERSIVTPVAGTTRDVVEETVRLGDVCLRLADTAGLHETADPVEQIGVARARGRLQSAALVLAVFDTARPLGTDDQELLDALDPEHTIAILNKTDLPGRFPAQAVRQRFPHTVEMAAGTGLGLDALQQQVEQVTGLCRLTEDTPLLAGERQLACARRAYEALEQALRALDDGMTLDAVSVQVDEALGAVLELTGEKVTDAVVDEIFSRFCVGK